MEILTWNPTFHLWIIENTDSESTFAPVYSWKYRLGKELLDVERKRVFLIWSWTRIFTSFQVVFSTTCTEINTEEVFPHHENRDHGINLG